MKKLLWLVIIVVVLGAIWWMMSGKKAVAPNNEVPAPTANTTPAPTAINQDLQGLDTLDLNNEFQAIDQNAQSL